jgi:hypothetical protein
MTEERPRPIRVSIDLDPELYAELVAWTIEATPRAGYRTRIPTAVVVRTCIQLLMTWEELEKAVIAELQG